MKLEPVLWLLPLHVAWTHAQAAGIRNLFMVDTNTCGDLLVDGTLQLWVNEGLLMAQALQNYFQAAQPGAGGNPPVPRAYFRGLMSLSPGDGSDNSETAEETIDRVVDFLQTAEVPEGNRRAYLYCSDSAFQKVSPSDTALQRDGVSPQTNDEGQSLTVKQAYSEEYSNTQRTGAYFLGAPVNQYFFQSQFILSPKSTTPCGGVAGATYNLIQDTDDVPVILLCPSSIIYRVSQDNLNQRSPNPVRPYVPAIQPLEYMLPKSFVLLHEIFHYAPWPAIQVIDYAYFTPKCSRLSPDDSVFNAQSYVYVALGAWLSDNKQVNGKVVSYASGTCYYVL